MRKFISVIVVLSIFCVFAAPSMAGNGASVAGSVVAADAGSVVEFCVSIAENPGISSFRIYLEYDKEIFSPQRADDGSLLVTAGEVTKSGMLVSNETETGCQIMWGSGKDADGDGALFSLFFETDAFADGIYPIKVLCVPEDTGNAAGEQIDFLCKDGEITLNPVPVISVGSAKGFSGDSVTVPVRLDRNPGFATAVLTFSYDPSRLQLTGIKKGALLASSSGSFSRNVSAARVLWYDSVDTNGDGVLFELTFTILGEDGYTELPVSAELTGGAARNFGSVKDPDIPVAFVEGTVACRAGELIVDSAAQENGVVILTMKDAPREAVIVIVASYENGKMGKVTMADLILEADENVFPYAGDTNITEVKVFLLCRGSYLPLCDAVEVMIQEESI